MVEIRNISRKRRLYSKVVLTDAQEREIIDFWRKTSGIRISTKWHRLYQSYSGIYNKKYFPEILYTTKLEPILSPEKFYGILSDKGLLTSIFPGGSDYRHPKTIVCNSYSVFTDENRVVISNERAIRLIDNCGVVILKPTIDTSSGEGVRKLVMQNGKDIMSNLSSEEILKQSGSNFIIQECVHQSSQLSKLYPESVNTFRIITYICQGKVFHAPLSMRIGTGGSVIDNIHAGGMVIGITEEFKLREFAFTEMGDRFSKHPDTGKTFKGFYIPELKTIVSVAERLHGYLPQIQMISWDWTLDDSNMPVLIEINISGQSIWFPQMVNGEGMFRDQTEYFAGMLRSGRGRCCVFK